MAHIKLTIFLVLLSGLSLATSYKILGVLQTGGPSHHIVGSALMKGLARKGHQVTVISPFPLTEPMENYHDITIQSIHHAMKAEVSGFFDSPDHSVLYNVVQYYNTGVNSTRNVLNEPNVKALMSTNQTFDAIIIDVTLSEALYGLSEHFQAPLIGLSTFGAISWNTDMVGSPSPPSYVPHPLLGYTDRMTLAQRVANLAFIAFERAFLDFSYYPRQEALYRQYFPHNKRSMRDIMQNTALVLMNQHVSLSFPRPYMPNHIEVGGMQINRTRSPLPADMQNFLDEAEDGVIYFSMGSNLKSKNFPVPKLNAFLNTFRGLKQRVLWKFEKPNLPGKPDNVFISDWFPQDDILAHPKVLIFITHGGLLSTTEAIYHGKPFIGIPIFGDQFLNMARAEAMGYGIMIDYTKLTEVMLRTSIQRILSVPTYKKLIIETSKRFRDHEMDPLDKAVYWVEHVARHRGAKYLHCAGMDMNFVQYHNIDALIILIVGSLVVFFSIMLIIRLLWLWLQFACVKNEQKVKEQ